LLFVMAGGGTGGHVVPALAVADELRRLGHESLFAGTRQGIEASLAPRAGFPIEWIEIGGLQRVGARRTLRTLWQLPSSVARSALILRRCSAAAVFSMGGYVAAPVMIAARLLRVPVVVMEPNAMPGLVSRVLGRSAARVLLNFEQARRHFPGGRTELTGLPVRREFFDIQSRPARPPFTVLITGGSRGSQTLNRVARESWPLFKSSAAEVRFIVQTGPAGHAAMAEAFAAAALEGETVPFIAGMPAAYARADLVVSRSGAGAVSEIAAAGKPSILVPFPYAADDHQRHNAEAMAKAGAALVILEAGIAGPVLFDAVAGLLANPARLESMGRAARALARPGAARRAADLLLEVSGALTPARLPGTIK
jgi:UDP-N-acetylglucosamine--N-acetylmuramyl-(pentapeptide) pyrophosphoryl-undecaprenol N-acetylglucosamine transferase